MSNELYLIIETVNHMSNMAEQSTINHKSYKTRIHKKHKMLVTSV